MLRLGLAVLTAVLALAGTGVASVHGTFAPGDLVLSFENGSVQWRMPDGTLHSILVGLVPGPAEGMRFDAAGNLYVARWCGDPFCQTGNTVERFNTAGRSQGMFGWGYCSPHAVAVDAAGTVYVGQADCDEVLKFTNGQLQTVYAVAPEYRGAFWIDLAEDGCTLFYTSWGPNVKRFNVCTNKQLANFNQAPLPGGETQAIRLLPDGGVLVSSGAVIARLNASGALVRTYTLPTGERQYWAGLDLVGDGTFWSANYFSSGVFNANVFRFDLATGEIRGSFNTRTAEGDIVDIRVSPGSR